MAARNAALRTLTRSLRQLAPLAAAQSAAAARVGAQALSSGPAGSALRSARLHEALPPFAVRGVAGTTHAGAAPKDSVSKAETDADLAVAEKEIEEEYEHVTGIEKEEVLAEHLGLSRFEAGPAVGPFGTRSEPAIIESVYNERMVGCTGGEGDDEHDPVWMRLETGDDAECPDCGQMFRLTCVGDGGYPYTGHLRLEGGGHEAIHH